MKKRTKPKTNLSFRISNHCSLILIMKNYSVIKQILLYVCYMLDTVLQKVDSVDCIIVELVLWKDSHVRILTILTSFPDKSQNEELFWPLALNSIHV
jgi:hypothetical protein